MPEKKQKGATPNGAKPNTQKRAPAEKDKAKATPALPEQPVKTAPVTSVAKPNKKKRKQRRKK